MPKFGMQILLRQFRQDLCDFCRTGDFIQIQVIKHKTPLSFRFHQIGLPEDTQVLRRDRLFDVQLGIYLIHAARLITGDKFNNLKP